MPDGSQPADQRLAGELALCLAWAEALRLAREQDRPDLAEAVWASILDYESRHGRLPDDRRERLVEA